MPPTTTTTHATTADLETVDLGRIAYQPAFDLQQRVHADVLARRRPPTLLLLEHDPVITISRRGGVANHLLADPQRLEGEGIKVCPTDRGGDITYHGPGQLVAYPILPLDRLGLNLRQYVRMLEQIIIDTATTFGVHAHRDACAVGVWVGGEASQNEMCGTRGKEEKIQSGQSGGESAKLAAIGVRVRRWVSMHGLALNVTTNLDHFNLIVPCGLTRPVTSLRQQLGDRCPAMPQVKAALTDAFHQNLSRVQKQQTS